jgi:hypothetical protein
MELAVQLAAAVDRRVHDEAARVGLVGVVAQLEVFAEAGRHLGEIVVCRRYGSEAARPFERLLAGGEICLAEQCRRVTVLCGAARLKRLRHRAKHLADAGRLRCRQAERPHHLLGVEAEQLADRGGGAEHARRRGDVPAGRVVRGIHGVADARFHLEPQDERVHEIAARHRVRARIGEQCRADGHARMNEILGQSVVVLVDVRADAVHQRRVQRVETLGAAEHAGRGVAGIGRHGSNRGIECRLDAAAERAA